MKRDFHLTIRTAAPVQNKGSALLGFFCSFLLFFFACGSFLLNFSLIFSPGFSPLATAGLWGIPGLLGTLLFTCGKSKRFPVIFAGTLGLLFLLLYLFRENFFLQLSSSAGALRKLVSTAYNLRIFPGCEDYVKNKWTLCLFLTILYILLLLLVMLWKKRLLFVLLLGQPILISYLLELTVPVTYFILPLGAFILWRGTLWPQSVSRMWLLSLPAQAILLSAACLFTPLLSPYLFHSSQAFSDYINTIGSRLLSGGKTNSALSPERAAGAETFSYELQAESQLITSTAPSFTSQKVLSLEADKEVTQPLYLRGFIGSDYENYQWTTPQNEEWYIYAQSHGILWKQARELYTLPMYDIPAENLLSLTIEFSESPAFTYLPMASKGDGIFLSENNRITGRTSSHISIQCFPLTLDNMDMLSLDELSGNSQVSLTYASFCRDRYTSWEENTPGILQKELDRLPVYSSMPEIPSDQDIQKAAGEIQNFLWDHASYSLSLNPFTSDIPLSQELLYEQKKGFCIHFASVGTQLFRMYGIPARYVSGYSVLPDMLEENSQGSFTGDIPDSRAHAWVEVYTQSGGWVPVEVTPDSRSSTLQDSETSEPAAQDLSEQENAAHSTFPENSSSVEDKKSHIPETMISIGKVFLFMMFFLGVLLLLLLFIRRLLFSYRMGYFARTPSQAYITVFQNLVKLWEVEFSIEARPFTDSEYFRLLSEKLPAPLKEEFAGLYKNAESFAYGREKPSSSQLRNLRRCYLMQQKDCQDKKKGFKKLLIYLHIL